MSLSLSLIIRHNRYEAGPGADVGGQYDTACPELSNMIHAMRSPGMKTAMIYDAKEVWWGGGGDIYHQFSIEGKCSRYGCWGATEFWTDVDTIPDGAPKTQAVLELSQYVEY